MTDIYEKWAQDYGLGTVRLTKPANDELAVIQVGTVAGRAVFYMLQDEEFILSSVVYKSWLAAHRGMLAACEVGDWDCAAQDAQDAIESGPKELMAYYKGMMSHIISALRSGDGLSGEAEKLV